MQTEKNGDFGGPSELVKPVHLTEGALELEHPQADLPKLGRKIAACTNVARAGNVKPI